MQSCPIVRTVDETLVCRLTRTELRELKVIRSTWLSASALLILSVAACALDKEVMLGPADGHDLPPADTGRVQVGDEAPDFSLVSYAGDIVTLSQYRGSRDVVLVFYRGSW